MGLTEWLDPAVGPKDGCYQGRGWRRAWYFPASASAGWLGPWEPADVSTVGFCGDFDWPAEVATMNKCGYCGMRVREDYPVEFRCGSVLNVYRSRECMENEIGLLKEAMSGGLTRRVRRAIFQVNGQVSVGNETVAVGVACQLERELRDANRRVEELEEYVSRLEGAGDLLADWHLAVVTTREKAERDVARWNEVRGGKR